MTDELDFSGKTVLVVGQTIRVNGGMTLS